MQKANYLNSVTSAGDAGKYPLSTQALDFIQQQITLLQALGYIAGPHCILKEPDGQNSGLVFIDGELYLLSAVPVRGEAVKYINITEKKEAITADSVIYQDARIFRTAAYSAHKGGEGYEITSFVNLTDNTQLADKCEKLPVEIMNRVESLLNAKMTCSQISRVSIKELDKLVNPCIVSFRDSEPIEGFYNYSVMVLPFGEPRRVQIIMLPDGTLRERIYDGKTWGRRTQIANLTQLAAAVAELPDKLKKEMNVPGRIKDLSDEINLKLLSKVSILELLGYKDQPLNIDGFTTPSLVRCKNGNIEYGVEVIPCGYDKVIQKITYPDGSTCSRVYNGIEWESCYDTESSVLKLELKAMKNRLYIKHENLPSDARIILMLKKRRSKWRRTGGEKSNTPNKGKREERTAKRQYVHHKGIVLSKGNAGEWYEPTCVEVKDVAKDSQLVGLQLSGITRSLVSHKQRTVVAGKGDWISYYVMFGVRNVVHESGFIEDFKGKSQGMAYCEMAVCVERHNGIRGELARFRYRIQRDVLRPVGPRGISETARAGYVYASHYTIV